MTDQNNIPDTFGGGAHKRREERLPAHLLPKPVTSADVLRWLRRSGRRQRAGR